MDLNPRLPFFVVLCFERTTYSSNALRRYNTPRWRRRSTKYYSRQSIEVGPGLWFPHVAAIHLEPRPTIDTAISRCPSQFANFHGVIGQIGSFIYQSQIFNPTNTWLLKFSDGFALSQASNRVRKDLEQFVILWSRIGPETISRGKQIEVEYSSTDQSVASEGFSNKNFAKSLDS